MTADLWSLYAQMLRSRRFEEVVAAVWQQGLISGEMHLGVGEEAVVAGVTAQLREGDAMALDHRGTPPLLMRGVDGGSLLREMLGRPDGLCGGMGGHMHLFASELLSASSGIVGASGPAAAGFALAATHLRPGSVAVAFFGEGALNQGMLLESLNLAKVWNLPAVFVCKDSQLAIATRSAEVSATSPAVRARAFGLPAEELDGWKVECVFDAAQTMVERARSGGGPSLLHAHCVHLEGHFLGDQLIASLRRPIRELAHVAPALLRSAVRGPGASARERLAAMLRITALTGAYRGMRLAEHDPLRYTRRALRSDPQRLAALEQDVAHEMEQLVTAALQAA
jgi:acetoin:2,6-dichlorophenolindophenol oxidoreductase subunit alpha